MMPLSVDFLKDKHYKSEMRTRFWGEHANKYKRRLFRVNVFIVLVAIGEAIVILEPYDSFFFLLPICAVICAGLGWMLSQSDWHGKYTTCSQAYMLWGQAAEFYEDLYERAKEGEKIGRAEIAGIEKILTGLAARTRVTIGKPDKSFVSKAESDTSKALGLAD